MKNKLTTKERRYCILLGLVFACVFLFTACSDTFNQYGKIGIVFTGEEDSPQTAMSFMARTVFPLAAFDSYIYTFIKAGEEDGEVKAPDSEGFFSLEVGNYTVEVEAYISNEDSYILTAIGVSGQFSVVSGYNNPVTVYLSAVDNGTGTFNYTITYPEDATIEITLEKWPALDAVTLDPINLSEDENGITEILSLEVGSYLLTISVRKNGFYAGLNEAIHIYPLLSTIYTEDFKEEDLLTPSYTVIFDATDGSVILTSAATGVGRRLVTLPIPTKIGYTFNGWWTDETEGAEITTNTVFTEDTTIYARWIENIYTVTFDANDGTVTTASADTITGRVLETLPEPERNHFVFAGWWTDEMEGTEVTTSTVFTEDTTIYARWIENIYTITFDANDGTVTPASADTITGRVLETLPTPERNHFVFAGWWTDEMEGTEITTNTVFTEDTTIYARWTESIYTITLDANGGTVTPASADTITGRVLETLPEPERTGHTFNGWWTEIADGIEVDTSYVFTANTTIYARWTESIYIITFDANGGTVTPASADTIAGRVLENLPTPEKSEFIFVGWWTDEMEGTEITTSTVFTEDTTIYARWIENIYTATANGDPSTLTTQIVLNFSADPVGLTIADIDLGGSVTKGSATLSDSGTSRTISGFTVNSNGNATITIARSGIESEQKIVSVFLDEMVLIPSGSFQRNGYTITITGFYMGKYEVTQEKYQTVMGVNPSNFLTGVTEGEDQNKRPVERVTWFDAIEFCNELSELEGLEPVYTLTNVSRTNYSGISQITAATVAVDWAKNGYRLPTEAQWEYACRADTTANYYWGTETDTETVGLYAWFDGNANSMTHAVGEKLPNDWGLYDMSGNVFEWCWDWFASSYPNGDLPDPVGVSSGTNRVTRGGGFSEWNGRVGDLASTRRLGISPDSRSNEVGFRVLRPYIF